MSVMVSVSGLRELDRALGMLPKSTARNVLKRTLDKAAQPIVAEAKRQAPVKTGTLRDSITASTRIKNKTGSAEFASAMKAGLGKAAARSALLAAWDSTKDQALSIIKAELGSEIIKAARRVGRSKKQSLAAKQSASMAALMAFEAGY